MRNTRIYVNIRCSSGNTRNDGIAIISFLVLRTRRRRDAHIRPGTHLPRVLSYRPCESTRRRPVTSIGLIRTIYIYYNNVVSHINIIHTRLYNIYIIYALLLCILFVHKPARRATVRACVRDALWKSLSWQREATPVCAHRRA